MVLGGKKRAVKFTQSPTNERTKRHPNIHKYICMYDVHVYIVYIVKSVLFVCLRFCLSFCPQSAERVRKTRHTYLHFSHEYIHKYVQMYICIWTYRQAGGVAPTSFVFYFFSFGSVASWKINERHFYAFSICIYVCICMLTSECLVYVHTFARSCVCMSMCVCVWVCVYFGVFIYLLCFCFADARQQQRSSDLTTYECVSCVDMSVCVYMLMPACVVRFLLYLFL